MSAAATRVLDGARSGRGMVWVLAIMLFLTVLATAAGIGTARAATALGRQLAGRATVQIATADAGVRAAQAARALAVLRQSSAVAQARAVPPAELARLLGPWLAGAGADALPVPALIDVDLAEVPDALARVTAMLARVAPGARVERHDDVMAPVARLLAALTALAAGLVALMAAATAAVVVLATRSGLDAHRTTIEVMHGLGATDGQVARLFQRRIARDAAAGSLLGGAAALAIVALLGRQVAGTGSALLAGVTLGGGGWAALMAVPFAFVLLAAIVARGAITRTLARTA
jgi:cell division transport system permease protein